MAVVAILLFGSLARGDHSQRSDTDLLMISDDDETRHVSVGHLSMFLYSWSRLERDAKDGDLFACHLVREAKAIVDPDDYLSRLKTAFRFRPNYAAEIVRATDLGWFLAKFGDELNSALLARRILVHSNNPYSQRRAPGAGLRPADSCGDDTLGRGPRTPVPPPSRTKRCGVASLASHVPHRRNDARPLLREGRSERARRPLYADGQQGRTPNPTPGGAKPDRVCMS